MPLDRIEGCLAAAKLAVRVVRAGDRLDVQHRREVELVADALSFVAVSVLATPPATGNIRESAAKPFEIAARALVLSWLLYDWLASPIGIASTRKTPTPVRSIGTTRGARQRHRLGGVPALVVNVKAARKPSVKPDALSSQAVVVVSTRQLFSRAAGMTNFRIGVGVDRDGRRRDHCTARPKRLKRGDRPERRPLRGIAHGEICAPNARRPGAGRTHNRLVR